MLWILDSVHDRVSTVLRIRTTFLRIRLLNKFLNLFLKVNFSFFFTLLIQSLFSSTQVVLFYSQFFVGYRYHYLKKNAQIVNGNH